MAGPAGHCPKWVSSVPWPVSATAEETEAQVTGDLLTAAWPEPSPGLASGLGFGPLGSGSDLASSQASHGPTVQYCGRWPHGIFKCK